jgi:spoIIIJ-associated protein
MSHSDTEDQVAETEEIESSDPTIDAGAEADERDVVEPADVPAEDALDAADDLNASDGDDEEESDGDSGDAPDRLELEGDVAADYLEELLDIADLDGDLDMDVEGDRAVVSIVGADLNQLVGARGEVLDALQELTRLAVYRETGERSRLMLDISGHRARRREQLVELANETAARVKETGEAVSLKAMSPFERKVVHDAVAAAGLVSESEGVEPRRFVVVLPK